MRQIKEPEGIDFVIESKPLTNTKRKEISELIKTLKNKKAARKRRIKRNKKTVENP